MPPDRENGVKNLFKGREMTGPIRNQPASHHSPVADSSKVDNSTGKLRGARPIPVRSVLAAHQGASPSLPISDNAPDLLHARVRITDHSQPALPLPQLFSLQQHNQAGTNSLKCLLPLLQYDKAWTTENLDRLKKSSGLQLKYILPLAEFDKEWTADHFPVLRMLAPLQLNRLLPLLQHSKEWTTSRLRDLIAIDGYDLEELLLLLQYDMEWTTRHFDLLKKMGEHQWPCILPLLHCDRRWTTDHLHDLVSMGKDELRSCLLTLMDAASEGFMSAANPYVRKALSVKGQDIEEVRSVLQMHGASRSIINPGSRIDSYLTEKFKNNYAKIPTATFGVENEMFIPGLPEIENDDLDGLKSEKVKTELNDRLGITNEEEKKYSYKNDITLSGAPLATPPIEQATSILQFPKDIQRLQSVLSILNDWGAFTNRTAGVHIHIGMNQWNAADCLKTREEKSLNPFLHQWDQDREYPSYRNIDITITPYKLLFMKKFLVNMVSMQKDFYLVAKKSKYSQPNGQPDGRESDLDKYCQDISSANNYKNLLLWARFGKLERAEIDELLMCDSDDEDEPGASRHRCFNVNLEAYKKFGTIEVRGFTKKNSDNMEIDPNLPARDLIFLQEVLIKVLHDTKNVLLSGASPDDPIEVRPSAGLAEIVKDYVQDVFLLEIIHALGQRNPEKRVKTMEAIVKDKDLITSETLQKIREGQESLFEDDPSAQHFLAALSHHEQWNPASIKKELLKRKKSLRSMADASFEAIYRSHKSHRLV